MANSDSVSRRKVLKTAIALGATGALYLLRDVDAASLRSSDAATDTANSPWSIRGGHGLGPILLGASQREVIEILGEPQDTFDFPGATAQELCDALGETYDPEVHCNVAPRFFLKYLDLGISVDIRDGVVTEINAFTGHLSGYQKGDYAAFQGDFATHPFTLVSTKDQILETLGVPCCAGQNEYADIPKEWLKYYRIGLMFDFNSETKQLSSVTVCQAG